MEEGILEGSSESQDEIEPMAIPENAGDPETINESNSLCESDAMTSYGSMISSLANRPCVGPPSLELPDPAISPDEEAFPRHNRAWRHSRFNPNPHTTPPWRRLDNRPGDMNEGRHHGLARNRNFFKPRRTVSTPDGRSAPARPSRLRRIFSSAGADSPSSADVPLEAYTEFDKENAEYFKFLDKELDKIEAFYKMKEAEASERLQMLRQQLHEMRDRRLEEVRAEQSARQRLGQETERQGTEQVGIPLDQGAGVQNRTLATARRLMQPIEHAVTRVGPSRIGKVTKSLQQWGSPPGPKTQQQPDTPSRPDAWRDFSRRRIHADDVPYRAAKRKLKLALQEFYRSLELLKSYALLNRTALRKINKKYDKAIKARPTGRYMAEKVNKAWFVQSEVLEGQIVAVEDLYARYFERGNHKVAVGKLRTKSTRSGDFSASVFRNGLLLAAGSVFGIEGIVYGAGHLASSNMNIQTDASYLLQVRMEPSCYKRTRNDCGRSCMGAIFWPCFSSSFSVWTARFGHSTRLITHSSSNSTVVITWIGTSLPR